MRTMTRRFYVASTSISEAIESAGECAVVKTLSGALEDATKLIEGGHEVRYVVEIVRIVRRKQAPIIVETVRKG